MAIRFEHENLVQTYSKDRAKWEKAIIEKVRDCANLRLVGTDIRNRMIRTDFAYYASRLANSDTREDKSACDNYVTAAERHTNLQIPLVASQVDSLTAILAQVFLYHPAVFPIVASPDKMEIGNQLEALNAQFARLGGWQAELLKTMRDAVKYNVFMAEGMWDWYTYTQQAVLDGKVSQTKGTLGYATINNVDPYNSFWDHSCPPNKVSAYGDNIGYTNHYRPVTQKQRMKLWERVGVLQPGAADIDWTQAGIDATADSLYYAPKPIVNLVKVRPTDEVTDWEAWAKGFSGGGAYENPYKGDHFETVAYIRIDPDDYHLPVPAEDIQVWRVTIHNMKHIVRLDLVETVNNNHGIIMGQLLDDNFGWQTKSPAESIIPIQDASSHTLNTRFMANQRAVDDRIIYNPAYIDGDSLNTNTPNPRIRMKAGGNVNLKAMKISDVLSKIPFDHSAVQLLTQDLGILQDFANELLGMNDLRQGQMVPGRRTATEVSGFMSHSNLRTGIYLLPYIFSFMNPLREHIKILTIQHGAELERKNLVNPVNGQMLDVKANDVVGLLLDIQYADGFWPKEMLANMSGVQYIFNLLATAPGLFAGRYDLGKMLEYLAHIMGVRYLSQFRLEQPTVGPGDMMQPGASQPDMGMGQPQRNQPESQPIDTGGGAV